MRDLRPTLAANVARYAAVLFDPPGEVNERGTVELEEGAKEEEDLAVR